MGKSNFKDGSRIVPDSSLPWDSLAEKFAPAPDRMQMINRTTAMDSSGRDELKHRVEKRRRLAFRCVVAAAILLGIFFARNIPFDSQSGQSGSAWASTEGYMLNVEVVSPGKNYDNPLTTKETKALLRSAIEVWAENHQIAVGNADSLPRAEFRLYGGGRGAKFDIWDFQINLLGVNEAAMNELVLSLSCIPGVAPPEVAHQTMFFSLGGLTEAMIGRKVFIDGKEFNFPQDFNWDEAQYLRHMFGADPEYRNVRFAAFFGKISDPIGGGERGIFNVGDIVRVGFTPEGDLEYTTVVDVWEEGRVLQERIADNQRQWWSKSLPYRMNEADFDYKAALYKSKQLLHLPLDLDGIRNNQFKLRLLLEYQVFPIDRLLKPVAQKYTANELAHNVAMYTQAKDLLDEWCAEHLEYNYSLERDHNLHLGPMKFGELPLFIYVGWGDDDEALVGELGKLFSRIEGMPEPHVEVSEIYPNK